jgi:uncharacterized membrane protein YgcG
VKRLLIAVAYALVGLVLAVGLTAGAYAIGGRDLSKPARPFELTNTNREVETDPVEPDEAKSPEDSPSPDDEGGDDDKSGSNSGSGSSNSGSGSSNSGSGSSNSGSGSGDDEPDDD